MMKKILVPAVLIIIAVVTVLVWHSARPKNDGVVFDFWFAMGDEKGLSLVSRKPVDINGKEKSVVSISGILETAIPGLVDITFHGVYGRPNPATLQAMKSMKSISFTYRGDGNRYYICFPTTETIDYRNIVTIGKDEIYGSHWLTILETEEGEISTVSINIPEDLIWLGESGTHPPYIPQNFNCFQVQPADPGTYHLQWWDIRLD